MIRVYLQEMVDEISFDGLPVNWNAFDIGAFSRTKSLWEYQRKADVLQRLYNASSSGEIEILVSPLNRDKPCPYIFQEPRYLGKLFLKRDTMGL